MSTAELKSNLHKLIVETDDINILQKIQEVFNALRSIPINGDLSAYEMKMIELGLKDVEQGKVVSNDKVKARLSNWINEKQK